MKIYTKMKAAVIDLSEALDEVASFNAYVKEAAPKLAYVHAADDNRRITEEADFQGNLDAGRFTKLEASA